MRVGPDSFTYVVIYHPSPPRAALYTKTQEIFCNKINDGEGAGGGVTPTAAGAGATLRQRNPRGVLILFCCCHVVTRQMENKTEKTTTMENRRHGGSDQSEASAGDQ